MGARLDGVKPEVDAVLKADMADVEVNKVEQTPSFFVNGKQLLNFSEQRLVDMVKSEIETKG